MCRSGEANLAGHWYPLVGRSRHSQGGGDAAGCGAADQSHADTSAPTASSDCVGVCGSAADSRVTATAFHRSEAA
ncbi:unnamed protein product, partial [Closterium sp. Naga37s-1]